MKRVFALLLVAMLTVFSLAACGNDNKNNRDDNGGNVTGDNGTASSSAPGNNAGNDKIGRAHV